jgi:hypothetical protein
MISRIKTFFAYWKIMRDARAYAEGKALAQVLYDRGMSLDEIADYPESALRTGSHDAFDAGMESFLEAMSYDWPTHLGSVQNEPRRITVYGYEIDVNDAVGHLIVYHDGLISWDMLQEIKNHVWGRDSRAIEVYPADSKVVNTVNARHLWRLGSDDFCPDILGDMPATDRLESRVRRVWQEAESVFNKAA